MRCPHCNAPLEEAAAMFCGNCGQPVEPSLAREATVLDRSKNSQQRIMYPNAANNGYNTQQTPPQSPTTYSNPLNPGRLAPLQTYISSGVQTRSRRRVFLTIIAALLIVGIAAGAFTLSQHGIGFQKNSANTASNAGVATQAQALFTDSQNNQSVPDSVKITTVGLAAPPSGTHYAAWLVNVQNENILSLGVLSLQDQAEQPGQNGSVFVLNSVKTGTNLLAAGDKLEITQETTSNETLPTGRVLFAGLFPPLSFIHIKHLMVAFPSTPDHVGLLIGLRQQAQLLNTQAQLLKTNTNNATAVRCIAQNMLYLIEGNTGPDVQPRSQTCNAQEIQQQGDGFGLLGVNSSGYVALAAAHASLAATQSDSTALIKVHASHVEIAMNNLKGWLNTLDQDAHTLSTNPGSLSKLTEIATLADHAYNGVDTNNDGTIDPVPGEAGAITAYIHGELMATLPLKPGP